MADLCVRLVPLFDSLPIDDQMLIEKLVHHRNYQKNEVVMNPSSDNSLVILAYGEARLYTLDEEGRENVTRVLHTGDYAGETWLFGTKNRNVYIEATENSEICLINRKDFMNLIKHQPSLSIRLLELNSVKIHEMQQHIQLLSIPKIEDRLINYLELYSKKIGKNKFELSLKMKDFALYLGTTPETLSRKFTLLEKQHFLKRRLRQITLIEEAK